eukprot:m.81249 g.81249  ORF g.81249 m.81249 type:complete len:434 (+) comp14867_c0_seq1:71-1372(+)
MLLQVVGTAAEATGAVLLLCAVGIIAANYPRAKTGNDHGLVSRPVLATISHITTTLFLPCLTATSLGRSLSYSLLSGVWPLLLFSLAYVAIAAPLALLCCYAFRVSRGFANAFLVAASFQNVISMPLIVMDTLCAQGALQGEVDCFHRASTFTFILQITKSLMFWSVGYHLLSSDATAREGASLREEARLVMKNMLKPPMIGSYVGLLVGLTPPLQDAFFGKGAPLKFVTSAADTFAHAVVCLMMFILSVSLGKSIDVDEGVRRVKAWMQRVKMLACARRGAGNGASASDDEPLVLVERSTDADVDVAITATVTDDQIPAIDNEPQQHAAWSPPTRDVVALVVTRMIIVSGATFTATAFLVGHVFSGNDLNLLALTLLVVCVMPTANTVIVASATCRDRVRNTETLARALVFEYLLFIFTLIAFVSIALSLWY